MKEWKSMMDDIISDSLPTPGGRALSSAPATTPLDDTSSRQDTPCHAIGDPEMDIVDFQSMQSFPASDAPSWPRACAESAVNQANEQERKERSRTRSATSGMGESG
jgi:hypothetical protein